MEKRPPDARNLPRLLQLALDNQTKPVASVRSEVAGDVATLYIYGVIDDYYGVSAEAVVREIAAQTAPELEICINSPGGDIFAARAIATAIRGYAGKTAVCVDGLCASAATYIALAANEVEMAEGSFMMIHKAWTFAMGNADDLTATAALLEKLDTAISETYAKKTGKTPTEMLALMDAETWLTAQEAVDLGLADTVESAEEDAAEGESDGAANRWNLTAYSKVPKALTEPKPKIPAPPLPDDAVLLRAANERRLRLLELTST